MEEKTFFKRVGPISFLAILFAILFATPALADTPPGCTATGTTISLSVFRSDWTTPIGSGTVEPGETIIYKATLSWPGSPNCYYQGGTLTITKPNGATVSYNPVPQINNTTSFTLDAVYVVSASDVVDGKLFASASYTGGTSLLGPGQSVSNSTAISTTYREVSLQVSKTAQTSFERKYTWKIDKSAGHSKLTLSPGQTYVENYSVKVEVDSHNDSKFAVSGTITIHNPSTFRTATITNVSDSISGGINATVDCGVTFPYDLAAGGNLTCNYSAALPDGTNRTNTATVTTTGDIGGGTGTANVVFSAPTTEIDECVTVTDSYKGMLGTVCKSQAPKTYTYTREIGPYAEPDDCGEHIIENTATFETNDTATTGSDDWTLTVTVSCVEGCTLTQGYWKTHSEFGKAPYDETWALLASGASTPFFLSGQTWYKVFWTPIKGNVYYQLAHQYMAAKLNILNGADAPSSVLSAITQAETWLNTYTPAQAATWKASSTLRKQFTNTAALLASYNEGKIGPGHCDEDGTSVP